MIQVLTLTLRPFYPALIACLLAACGTAQAPLRTALHIGTDDGFHQNAGTQSAAIAFGLADGSSALPDGLFGGGSSAQAPASEKTTIQLRRSRSIGVSVSQPHKLGPRLSIEPQIYASIGQTRYALPDGVLLANNRTRLTDPITADFLALRVEPQASVFVTLGPAHKPWGRQGIGAGVALAHVSTSITSALIDAQGHTRVADPFVSATSQVGGTVLELRRYRDFGTTGKIEWRLPLQRP